MSHYQLFETWNTARRALGYRNARLALKVSVGVESIDAVPADKVDDAMKALRKACREGGARARAVIKNAAGFEMLQESAPFVAIPGSGRFTPEDQAEWIEENQKAIWNRFNRRTMHGTART